LLLQKFLMNLCLFPPKFEYVTLSLCLSNLQLAIFFFIYVVNDGSE
jgi:hypothetical protein